MKIHDYQKMKYTYNCYFSINDLEPLIENGDGYDNCFRDLNNKDKEQIYCSYKSIFQNNLYSGDFVWNGRNHITTFKPMFPSSGGHPALTEQGVTYCAGIIDQYNKTFNFHSGHFRPKAINIIPFMFKFIDNSLEQTIEKEACLEDWVKEINISIYYDNSSTLVACTTFYNLYSTFLKNSKFNSPQLEGSLSNNKSLNVISKSQFFSFKKELESLFSSYINNKFINIFSFHHHNNRAIAIRKAISQSADVTSIKKIINCQLILFKNKGAINLKAYEVLGVEQRYSSRLKNSKHTTCYNSEFVRILYKSHNIGKERFPDIFVDIL